LKILYLNLRFFFDFFKIKPDGTGFISPDILAFLLFELYPPLGMKNDNL
jgi:hypothetical protein